MTFPLRAVKRSLSLTLHSLAVVEVYQNTTKCSPLPRGLSSSGLNTSLDTYQYCLSMPSHPTTSTKITVHFLTVGNHIPHLACVKSERDP